MPIRQTKYGYSPRAFPQQESRVSIFEPTLGLDAGQAPQELFPGCTPISQNFEHVGGYLQPRSGMSRYDATYSLGDAAMFGMEAFDIQGRRSGVAASAQTISYLPSGSLVWSTLSYVAAAGASGETANARLDVPWDGTQIYEPARDQNIVVLTNHKQLPKFLNADPSNTTFSDFTWVASRFSRARSVCEHDYRLVWANLSSSSQSFPNRVYVSVRGNPLDMNPDNGAYFEDLMDMRGDILRVVPDRDTIVMFSGEQIWRGRKRSDRYAYDFYCVNRSQGCPYPRTIQQTPQGIVFLGRDLELYLLSGDQTIALGPTNRKAPEQGDASRIQLFLQRNMQNGNLAWSVYNSQRNRYELHFTSNEVATNLYPQTCLHFNFDNQSFFVQKADGPDWSAGFEMQDVDEAVTWDSVPYTWDQYNTSWEEAGLGAPARRVVVFSSAGTPYRFRSDQTTDDGTAIDCRWRSHGLGGYDAFRYDQLYEVWIEYASNTSSAVSVWTSDDLGTSFVDAFGRTLSATSNRAEMFPTWITAQSPVFEVRTNDGSVPKISRIQVRLRDAGLHGGAM